MCQGEGSILDSGITWDGWDIAWDEAMNRFTAAMLIGIRVFIVRVTC